MYIKLQAALVTQNGPKSQESLGLVGFSAQRPQAKFLAGLAVGMTVTATAHRAPREQVRCHRHGKERFTVSCCKSKVVRILDIRASIPSPQIHPNIWMQDPTTRILTLLDRHYPATALGRGRCPIGQVLR